MHMNETELFHDDSSNWHIYSLFLKICLFMSNNTIYDYEFIYLWGSFRFMHVLFIFVHNVYTTNDFTIVDTPIVILQLLL